MRPVDIPYDLTWNIDWKLYEEVVSEAVESIQHQHHPPFEEYNLLAGLILDAALQAQTKK